MNVNKLIVLLDCYRGFDHSTHKHGGLVTDLTYLRKLGFIAPTSDRFYFRTTEKGDVFCQHLVTLGKTYENAQLVPEG